MPIVAVQQRKEIKMTNNQIKWASQHDWYIGTANGSVTVRGDTGEADTLTFSDFGSLHHWAGY